MADGKDKKCAEKCVSVESIDTRIKDLEQKLDEKRKFLVDVDNARMQTIQAIAALSGAIEALTIVKG
jgi:hypothetical protein